jgi:hypothetical protein
MHMDGHIESPVKKKSREIKFRRGAMVRWILAVLLVCTVALCGLAVLVSISPVTGTYGADMLRKYLGPKPVAILESVVFTIQDAYNQIVFKINPHFHTDPWSDSLTMSDSSELSINIVEPTPLLIATTPEGARFLPPATPIPIPIEMEAIDGDSSDMAADFAPRSTPATQTFAPAGSDDAWNPGEVIPMSDDPNEGVWTDYILDTNDVPLAYKTFLNPDSDRPYVIAGIVAVDLARVQLHFQLGTHEPQAPGMEPGSGQIEAEDMQPGILLAAFNGGFKTINGNFGVLFDGEERIPPITGMGTIAIFSDGSVRIGEWGSDLTNSPDMSYFRQNCPLMVRNGEINPLVYNNSVNDWGGTISGNIVTFRSGVGISQDGRTLYYFAGNNLSMPALAEAMLNAGVYQAMQLDINNYYVLFTRFEFRDQAWIAVPLLPRQMVDKLDRFLGAYSHDFFYLTVKTP